ncbi:uncharacterized protein B0H64DRAFT_412195 [Chaetomium fimeti]|uniref:Uncharacterized protein n=1 Tax=Chaetomium fimeti TaxID=1854472 RepID=A0AAE0H5I8_9PEZI|nr:hypothetical protein B0H64DRAFT_412195 [Chaetomium fimeti]
MNHLGGRFRWKHARHLPHQLAGLPLRSKPRHRGALCGLGGITVRGKGCHAGEGRFSYLRAGFAEDGMVRRRTDGMGYEDGKGGRRVDHLTFLYFQLVVSAIQIAGIQLMPGSLLVVIRFANVANSRGLILAKVHNINSPVTPLDSSPDLIGPSPGQEMPAHLSLGSSLEH